MNNAQKQLTLTSYEIYSQCVCRYINHTYMCDLCNYFRCAHGYILEAILFALCLFTKYIQRKRCYQCFKSQQILENFSSGVLTFCWK